MRPLLLLTLLASPGLAQFDADAPEPIRRVRGEVLVHGAEAEGFRAEFLEGLDGGDRLVLLGAPGVDLASEEAAWAAAGRAPVDVPLTEADAVFLVGDPTELARSVDAAVLGAALVSGVRLGARGATARALGARCLGAEGLGAGLGLLQGALLDPAHPGGAAPGPELTRALAKAPHLVGLAVEPTGHLRLEQRWLRGSEAAAFVAAGAGRPLRALRLEGRARGDLTSLTRSATSRALRPWPPSAPAPPRLERGALMLGGGPMPRGTLERFIELAGGPEAPLVYIPCSYSERIDSEPGFVRALRRAGAQDVRWLHTKDRALADRDPVLLAKLDGARGVWFGGGRQWNLVDSYQHTAVHRRIEQLLASGGVVGGSSAGASIQADYMARGNPLGNLDIMAEGYEEGLGLLTGVAVDQHFTQRGRLPDLQSLVAAYPQYLGVGIDEGAVLVVQGQVGEVLGSAVHFLDGEEHHRRVGGQRFDLVTRTPLD